MKFEIEFYQNYNGIRYFLKKLDQNNALKCANENIQLIKTNKVNKNKFSKLIPEII